MQTSDRDKCPSCGVKYIDHLGLIGTCRELQKLRSELFEQKNVERLCEILREQKEIIYEIYDWAVMCNESSSETLAITKIIHLCEKSLGIKIGKKIQKK